MRVLSLHIYLTLLAVCLSGTSGFSQNEEADHQLAETSYFVFHSNFWVNMHHFLYEKASTAQVRKLARDGYTFSWPEEDEILSSFSPEENKTYKASVDYYKSNIISKDLLRDLTPMTSNLAKAKHEVMQDTLINEDLARVLNDFSKVYRSKLWKLHDEKNKSIYEKHQELVDEEESHVIQKMESLSGDEWPEEKVRIDLTAYANWAGAYTTRWPEYRVVISTIDPSMQTTAFIETVFHEGSHILFGFNSDIREVIYRFAKKEGLKTRDIWHSIMFYLCGKATADRLKGHGIEHNFIMDEKNIYLEYKTPIFIKSLDDYYHGDIDMERMVASIIPVFKEK